MAESCTVVRFSSDQSSARIESLKRSQTHSNDHGNNFDKVETTTTTTTLATTTLSTTQTFGTFYVVCILLSIVTYILDIGLACLLLYFYSVKGQAVYFALTLTFMVVPAIFMTAFSMRWYIIDHEDQSVSKPSLLQWTVRIVFLLLQLSPLLRYLDTLIYGLKSRIAEATSRDAWQSTRLYRQMLDEDTNVALLRLFHCFLHSAPQAVIQLMILLMDISHPEKLNALDKDVAIIQAWTVLAALVSVAWSLTSYHRSVRFARDDKEKILPMGTFIAFCWHLMSAVSRVLALSLLASIFPTWMGVVCALHWGVMATWLALGQHQTASCSNRCEELLLSAALGLAYVLAFLSPRDGPTRYVYLAYYLVCFMENTAALVVWCVANSSVDNPVLYYGAVVAQIVAFLLGIIFLLLYYKYCHPSIAGNSKSILRTEPSTDLDKPGYTRVMTSEFL